MSKRTKIALYVFLALSVCVFTWGFKSNYSRLMAEGEPKADSDLANVNIPDYQKKAAPVRTDYHLGVWGAGLVLSLVGQGLMVAHHDSDYFGGRTLKVMYNEEGGGIARPNYKNAKHEWARGNFLEANELFRDYLKEIPRE